MRYALLPLLLGVAGCSTMDSGNDMSGGGSSKQMATAPLLKADGTEVGTATLTRTSRGATLELTATAPGVGSYGLHLHTVGLCQVPSFESAGAHWNPASRQHGRDNPAGSHAGDMPNIGSSTDGKLTFKSDIPDAMWEGTGGMFDVDGISIIVHEKADDYRTDPSGNSGKRIYCGVFTQSR